MKKLRLYRESSILFSRRPMKNAPRQMRCIDRIQCPPWTCPHQGRRFRSPSWNWWCFYVSEWIFLVCTVHRHHRSFGAQIALASGATVIITSSSDAKLEVAKKLGVQHLINYKTNPNWEEEVLKIVSGRGPSVVLYCLINHPTCQDRGQGRRPYH